MHSVPREKEEKMITVKVDAFELRKLILDTNMPITDDIWKFLNDIDLEYTNRVVFITKDGKEFEFVKTGDTTVAKNQTVGHWENYLTEGLRWKCSECGSRFETLYHYCPNCGAKMDVETVNTYSIGKIELPTGVFRQIYDEERREDA